MLKDRESAWMGASVASTAESGSEFSASDSEMIM